MENTEALGESLLRNCLRFLAQDNKSKLTYLPASFSDLTFHLYEGDLHTGNPLTFMCMLADDVCIYNPIDSEETLQLFQELRALLDVMFFCENTLIWDLYACNDQYRHGVPWAYTWDLLSRLAREALTLCKWSVETPDISCETLLDMYSYGAYSQSRQV